VPLYNAPGKEKLINDLEQLENMLMLAFEICWTLLFLVLLVMRYLSVVTFEVGYDEFVMMGFAFGLGMLIRDLIGRR